MIKRTFRLGISIAFLIVIDVGCTKTDNKKLVCSLVKTDDADMRFIVDPNFHYSTFYVYNTKYQVAASISGPAGGQIGNTFTSYIYDAQGNVATTKSSSSNSITYLYDSKNNLIQKDDSGLYPSQDKYTYNSTGQLETVESSQWFSGSQYHYTYHYYYPDTSTKNPSSITDYDGTVVTEFEYDNKPNPEKILFPSIKPDNNITRSSTRAGLAGTPLVTTYIFEYNADGYPITRTDSNGELRTYEYECR